MYDSIATRVILAAFIAPGLFAQAPATQGPAAGPAAGRTAPEARPAVRPAAGQEQRPAAPATRHDLGSTRALFARTDGDKDGVITAREATAVGVQPRQFSAFDENGDGRITADEFVVGYRELVAEAGQTASPDLDAEATRIRAERRAHASEQERARQGRAGQDPAGQSPSPRADGATPARVRAAQSGTTGTGSSERREASGGGADSRGGADARGTQGGRGGDVRPAPPATPRPTPRPAPAPRPAPRPAGGGRG